jgi:hypothetical protein
MTETKQNRSMFGSSQKLSRNEKSGPASNSATFLEKPKLGFSAIKTNSQNSSQVFLPPFFTES